MQLVTYLVLGPSSRLMKVSTHLTISSIAHYDFLLPQFCSSEARVCLFLDAAHARTLTQ